MMPAVLCADRRGPYFDLVGADRCWDITRDARTFAGPGPVVAHPPCGPWGRLRKLCTRQDREVAFWCVDAVRIYGGVLEHPAGSQLFDATGKPRPGSFPDQYGGVTYETRLSAFGAEVVKPTWLYIVGHPGPIRFPFRTHRPTRTVQSLNSRNRQLTPIAMARYLIELANATTCTTDAVA